MIDKTNKQEIIATIFKAEEYYPLVNYFTVAELVMVGIGDSIMTGEKQLLTKQARSILDNMVNKGEAERIQGINLNNKIRKVYAVYTY